MTKHKKPIPSPTPEVPTPLVLIEKALTALQSVQADVTHAVKMLSADSKNERLAVYTRASQANVAATIGSLVFLRDKLMQHQQG